MARARLHVAAAMLVVAATSAGCTTDQGGHLWLAVNASDRDLVVDLVTDTPRSVRLPAHVRTWLSEGHATPTTGWHIVVRDRSCAPIATIDATDPRAVLVIRADGIPVLGTEADRNRFNDPLAAGERRLQPADLAAVRCS